MEDKLAYIGNKKAVMSNDRLRWLEIMHQQWEQYKSSKFTSKEDIAIMKENLKICSEMSLYYKNELSKIK